MTAIGPKACPNNMSTIAQTAIIGIDVSRDWLDIHCLPTGQRQRLPNTVEGHARLADLASSLEARVCFEATGGQEWRLRPALDAERIATRQLPPAQIKAFAASRGTRAKTDRIDPCPAVYRAAMSREGQSSSRASCCFDRMRDAFCHMKSCAFSGL
jgi:transposase